MNSVTLQKVNEEKDLGVIISGDLKPCKREPKSGKKANKILRFTIKAFGDKSHDIIPVLYN